MSEHTPEQIAASEKLEAAILECAAAYEGPGEMLTGWVLCASLTAETLMDDDSCAYLRLTPVSGQAYHVSLGLASYHHNMLLAGMDDE